MILKPLESDIAYALTSSDEKVQTRMLIERMVFRRTCEELFAHGFQLRVHDGEGWACERTSDIVVLMTAMGSTDEDLLHVYKEKQAKDSDEMIWRRIGFISFVYGNDGHDVISDYTTNLEDYIDETRKFCEALEQGPIVIEKTTIITHTVYKEHNPHMHSCFILERQDGNFDVLMENKCVETTPYLLRAKQVYRDHRISHNYIYIPVYFLNTK